jgi:hypothetical protein
MGRSTSNIDTPPTDRGETLAYTFRGSLAAAAEDDARTFVALGLLVEARLARFAIGGTSYAGSSLCGFVCVEIDHWDIQ